MIMGDLLEKTAKGMSVGLRLAPRDVGELRSCRLTNGPEEGSDLKSGGVR